MDPAHPHFSSPSTAAEHHIDATKSIQAHVVKTPGWPEEGDVPKREKRNRTSKKKRKRRRTLKKRQTPVICQILQSTLMLGLLRGQEEAARGSNFVFSPLLVHAALGLLAGILGEEEQCSVLSFLNSSTLNDLNTTTRNLICACRPSNNQAVLKISLANGIWVDLSWKLESSFLETVESIYKGIIKEVDFKTQYVETNIEINNWIEKNTFGLFKNFLPKGIPKSSTTFVLANALYFKGNWELEFKRSDTRVDNFYFLDGSRHIKVSFMIGKWRLEKFSSYKDFKVLVLPYQTDNRRNRQVSLTIFLPHKKTGLIDLMRLLVSDPTFIDRHLPKFKERVSIKIPKFKISSKFEATGNLKEMGLDIHHTKIFHGATIEVDEKGTTAAAAAATGRYGRGFAPPPPMNFDADHPFIYAIREEESRGILFFGHVSNPSES